MVCLEIQDTSYFAFNFDWLVGGSGRNVHFGKTAHPWIQPIWDGHRGYFRGKPFYFVSLAIGIILFEGGLTLKAR